MIPSPSHRRRTAARPLARAVALMSATALATSAAPAAPAGPISLMVVSGDGDGPAGPQGPAQVLDVMEQTKAILAGAVDQAEAALSGGFLEPAPDGGMQARPAHTWRVLGGPTVQEDRKASTGGTDVGLDTTAWGGSIGADWLVNRRLLVGMQLAQTRMTGSFAEGAGSYAGDVTLVTLLTAYHFSDSLSTHSSTSFGVTENGRILRRPGLQSGSTSIGDEQASGSTVETYQSSRSSLDYTRSFGAWSVMTSARFAYDRDWLRGYDESSGVAALSYGDSAIADYQAGARVRAERQRPVWGLWPFVEVEYDHDLGGGDYRLAAGPTRGQIAAYTTTKPYDSAASVIFGASWRVGARLEMGAVLNNRAEFGGRSERLSGGVLFVRSRF